MVRGKPVLVLLAVTVLAPIVLYTDPLGSYTNSIPNGEFVEESSALIVAGEAGKLNAVRQESSDAVKEPVGVVYAANSSSSTEHTRASVAEKLPLNKPGEHKSRVLSAADEGTLLNKEGLIEQVTSEAVQGKESVVGLQESSLEGEKTGKESNQIQDATLSQKQQIKQIPIQEHQKINSDKQSGNMPISDAKVRLLKDQLIRAKVYLSLGSTRNNPHFIKELRQRIKEIQRVLGDATKDSELQKHAHERMKDMEQLLSRGKQIQDDCSAVIKKLRAILHSTEEQLRVHKRQAMFLTQLAAKTLPKGLHCLPLRLTSEYYTLNSSEQQFPNQEKLEDPSLYHYALFSDNILATAVVVNSTTFHAKHPAKHVFHIVTDRLNYAAMRMWFLANPPGKASIQVQNIEEFTWLNSSYSPVLKQLLSPSMIDYYFRKPRANSDSNLKFRNPKYLSILNHLRFYLPEIFPKLSKVVFLDDDIVVQKDLMGLWRLNLKGKVNGAVETCGESFHRFDRYLNFSNPLIAKNFDPHACGWAYGMNVFDLAEWRKQNITEIYHSWQELNHDRLLWKLGTLPPGLITFWNRTFPLDRSWHVLGLGYNPSVNYRDIERAAVVHYNGNMKPWLEIGIAKYRQYWSKYLDYDQLYLRDCNITP